MKNIFSKYSRYLVACMVTFTLNVNAASNNSHIRLPGHVPSQAVDKADLVESLHPDKHIPMTFVLPLRNQKELEELIHRIYDPNDKEHYGKYLTTEEFNKRFAPTQKDYDAVIAYAKGLGLEVTNTHPNRTLLTVKGHTKSVESAFDLNLHTYQLENGRKFYAPNNDPAVPHAIASVISGVVGLDNHAQWKALNRRKEITQEMFHAENASAFPSGPNGGLAPIDIKTAYNLTGISADGTGQSIALFELGAYQASDINAYTTYFGLPAANLVNVLVDGGSGGAIDAEVTLDIELALALAPKSTIYVYEGPNSGQGLIDTYNKIASDNLAKQVSTSWGLGEDEAGSQIIQAENAIFQQMAAQGQTIYAAAGDSGAYSDYPNTKLVVLDPASQPYMVATGGTSLTVNSTTGAYVSESVWNNGVGNGAGGGGVSSVWAIPSWQANISTAYSQTNRNVPDISLNADQNKGYAIYYNGGWTLYGGTSCAAPLWAAFTALVNQQRMSTQMSALGFANPVLYSIAKAAEAANFHDITLGNNYFYKASSGYDNASGWGTFNGANLFASLTNSSTPGPTVSITSPANGSSVSGTITIAANATDSLSVASVDFYVDSILLGTDISAPFTMSFNTNSVINGQHTLTVVAKDSAGKSAQSSETITVNNITVSNVYINAGGAQITDSCTGIAWRGDAYYSGGQTFTSTSLPACLKLYATSRSADSFSYNIPLSNGNKYVILKFAETNFMSPGARVFNVNINGQTVISNLDVFREVGFGKPLDLSIPVTVTNGTLNLSFVSVVHNPFICGIEILPQY